MIIWILYKLRRDARYNVIIHVEARQLTKHREKAYSGDRTDDCGGSSLGVNCTCELSRTIHAERQTKNFSRARSGSRKIQITVAAFVLCETVSLSLSLSLFLSAGRVRLGNYHNKMFWLPATTRRAPRRRRRRWRWRWRRWPRGRSLYTYVASRGRQNVSPLCSARGFRAEGKPAAREQVHQIRRIESPTAQGKKEIIDQPTWLLFFLHESARDLCARLCFVWQQLPLFLFFFFPFSLCGGIFWKAGLNLFFRNGRFHDKSTILFLQTFLEFSVRFRPRLTFARWAFEKCILIFLSFFVDGSRIVSSRDFPPIFRTAFCY